MDYATPISVNSLSLHIKMSRFSLVIDDEMIIDCTGSMMNHICKLLKFIIVQIAKVPLQIFR